MMHIENTQERRKLEMDKNSLVNAISDAIENQENNLELEELEEAIAPACGCGCGTGC